MSDTTNPPCPRQIEPCPGRLAYRADPERLVCDACGRIWSLDEIAVLTGARR